MLPLRLSTAIASIKIVFELEPGRNYRAETKRSAGRIANAAVRMLAVLASLSDAGSQLLAAELATGEEAELRSYEEGLLALGKAAERLASQPIVRGPAPSHGLEAAIYHLGWLFEELTGRKPTHWLKSEAEERLDEYYAEHRVPGSAFAQFVRLVMPATGVPWSEQSLRTALERYQVKTRSLHE